jgi:hypothetical protein
MNKMSDSDSPSKSTPTPMTEPHTTVLEIAWRFAILGVLVGQVGAIAVDFAIRVLRFGPVTAVEGDWTIPTPAELWELAIGWLVAAAFFAATGVCLAYLHQMLSRMRSSEAMSALVATVVGAFLAMIFVVLFSIVFFKEGKCGECMVGEPCDTYACSPWPDLRTLLSLGLAGGAVALVCRLALRGRFARLPSD